MKQGWQIKDFELCLDKTKTTTKLQSSLYGEQGAFPIVSQEKELISGYWDKEEDVFKHKTPIVVFGDHTKVVKYIDFDFVIGADGVKILSPKPFLNPKYFYYWVCSVQIPSHGYARHYRYLKEHQVPVPNLSEQQRIVALLDAEFAKIDALKANAEKNLQNAKDLFQAALKKDLEPKEGWKRTTLQEICTHIVDCPHTTPIKSPSKTEYPCIRTSELKNGEISWETMQYVDKSEYLKRVSRLVPQENDIVYGREGTFGDAILIPNYYHFCLGQRTMLFRPNQELVIPRFLLLYVISPYVYDQAKAKNTGCGVGHVNVRDIKEFSINLPQINVQQSIVARLDALNEKCKTLQANYEKTLSLCDDLKQALLRKAFNGEI